MSRTDVHEGRSSLPSDHIPPGGASTGVAVTNDACARPAEPVAAGQCPCPCLGSCYGSLSPLPKWGRVPWNSPVNVKNLGAPEGSRNTSPRVAVNLRVQSPAVTPQLAVACLKR